MTQVDILRIQEGILCVSWSPLSPHGIPNFSHPWFCSYFFSGIRRRSQFQLQLLTLELSLGTEILKEEVEGRKDTASLRMEMEVMRRNKDRGVI
jgi:hypothetical protein